jgi:hypothetical protein
LLRQNTDIFIFKELKRRDLTLILKEFSTIKKTVPELLAMYEECNNSDITSFFMIDLSSARTDPSYMYRHNFTPLLG